MTQNQQDFIALIKPEAIKTYHKYKVLPSLTIAQAILESDWGTSILAIEANNLFGIKWTDDSGYDYVVKQTKEYINNQWITIDAKFRKYNSINDSIIDYALLLQNPRYEKVLNAKDYKEAAFEVWQAGYATDSNYPQKLIEQIEKFELYKIDNEVLSSINIKDFDQAANWAKDAIKKVIDKGIMIGDDQGFFNPLQPCTRQELAVIISRLLELNNYKG